MQKQTNSAPSVPGATNFEILVFIQRSAHYESGKDIYLSLYIF